MKSLTRETQQMYPHVVRLQPLCRSGDSRIKKWMGPLRGQGKSRGST